MKAQLLAPFLFLTFLMVPFALGQEERADEVSLKEIVEELNREHTAIERKKIFDSPGRTVGFQLRSKYDLWNQGEKSKVYHYFKSRGIEHPDWMSFCIYKAWELSQSESGIDYEAFLKKEAAIIKSSKAWSRTAEEEAILERDPYPPEDQGPDPFAKIFEDVESEGVSKKERSEKSPQTLYLMIRGIDPVELQTKYRNPLDALLREAEVGRIGVGSGDTVGGVRANGFEIEFSDFERGLPLLRKSIRDLAFPAGLTLDYTRDGFANKEYFKWHQRRMRVE